MKKTTGLILALAFGFGRVLSAAEPPPTDVVIVDHGKVDAAFARCMPLLVNSSFKIQAGRRVTAPGQVEIHEHDTDIFYITEGTATLVTGGKTEGAKPSGES